jgi:hypothetical protein
MLETVRKYWPGFILITAYSCDDPGIKHEEAQNIPTNVHSRMSAARVNKASFLSLHPFQDGLNYGKYTGDWCAYSIAPPPKGIIIGTFIMLNIITTLNIKFITGKFYLLPYKYYILY